MNALLAFCAVMAAIYVPWDFAVKPVAHDDEIWFGVALHGWAAKATEPLHFAIYAAGTYGFWRMRPWMWPWAAAYVAQIAIGMGVWSMSRFGGARGTVWAIAAGLPLAAIAIALWRARAQFQSGSSRA